MFGSEDYQLHRFEKLRELYMTFLPPVKSLDTVRWLVQEFSSQKDQKHPHLESISIFISRQQAPFKVDEGRVQIWSALGLRLATVEQFPVLRVCKIVIVKGSEENRESHRQSANLLREALAALEIRGMLEVTV
jgi:hypothetical protein